MRYLEGALLLILVWPGIGWSDDAREAALFGVETADQSEPNSPDKTKSQADEREGAIFGTTSEESAAPSTAPDTLADPLQIGGRLYLRTQTLIPDDPSLSEASLDQSALLYLYGDARPSSNIRAFVKARVVHSLSGTESTAFPTEPDPTSTDSETDVGIDQIWLKFNLARRVFVTMGQQPVRWGTARIWNPVDFVNSQRRDPLAIFDARPGVSLVKVHWPLESANMYAIAQFDDVNTMKEVGGLLRAEFMFGTSETALSAAVREGQPLRFGADTSIGVGPLELKAEAAVSRGGGQRRWRGDLSFSEEEGLTVPTSESRRTDWIPQAVASVEWGIPYLDEDTLYLTAEYFFNDAGYEDDSLYPWLISQREYAPLYLGRHYVGAGVVVPRPGNWNDSTILATGIANLSDGSAIARLDYQVRVLTRLSLFAYAAAGLGQNGEFRFKVEVPAIPDIEGLEDGATIEAPRWSLGFWLSVDL